MDYLNFLELRKIFTMASFTSQAELSALDVSI
jgi:hypothetical protein